MTQQILTVFLAAVALAAEPADDQSRIQGPWVLTRTERDGATVPDESLKGRGMTMVFEEDRVLARMGSRSAPLGTFQLTPSQTPKAYDRVYSDGTPRKGIYKFEGETLVICIASPGKDRPDSFVTKPGDGRTILVYARGPK